MGGRVKRKSGQLSPGKERDGTVRIRRVLPQLLSSSLHVVLGRPSPDAASELASAQHLSILAEAGLQLSPQGG